MRIKSEVQVLTCLTDHCEENAAMTSLEAETARNSKMARSWEIKDKKIIKRRPFEEEPFERRAILSLERSFFEVVNRSCRLINVKRPFPSNIAAGVPPVRPVRQTLIVCASTNARILSLWSPTLTEYRVVSRLERTVTRIVSPASFVSPLTTGRFPKDMIGLFVLFFSTLSFTAATLRKEPKELNEPARGNLSEILRLSVKTPIKGYYAAPGLGERNGCMAR
ncbi:hypothetical protein BJ875DRAFT_445491 [Amylocarpus encephaloides]|uniref:Uncharacterized protein n=1 Tax=Amylocarpus encephaloides TaxID=45428 RepID=A0A9P7Y9R9_9HELO|nr:hypothetical protein BJ875DRAFT_445491 [Amylocarpus encephaloides]